MPDSQTAAAPVEQWRVIHTYTRAEALDDGVLVDVTSTAKEAGFTVPTAITAAVHNECVEWTDDDAERSNAYQDQPGRLWDVLYLAATKARALARRNRPRDQVIHQLHVVPRPGRNHPRLRTLKLVIGPGHDHEPVATIMLPYED